MRKNEGKTVELEKPVEKLSRTRQKHTDRWTCNNSKCFDKEQEYIFGSKKTSACKENKNKQRLFRQMHIQVHSKMSETHRKKIFCNYYKLSTKEKKMFILNTTGMFEPERRRKGKNATNSKKKESFNYSCSMENDKILV